MYVVYLDILFIINWIMNTLIFLCVSLMLNKHIKYRYTILAGGLAALIYCMLLVIPVLQKIPYAMYALVIPIPSLLILYKPTHYKAFFKQYILSMFSSAIFGGMVFNLWYLTSGVTSRISSMSIFFLVAIGIGITTCFYTGFYFIRRQFIFPAFEYTLIIDYQGRDIKVQSLLDTGNLLYTPRRHEPVLVAEYDVMKPLLTESQKKAYENFRLATEDEIEAGIISGLYQVEQLIPFNSVGCKSGFLWGIRVDGVQIQKYNQKVKVMPCMIGLSGERLFSDGQFHALLHPEFILEEEEAS